jgi:hypothetical protein
MSKENQQHESPELESELPQSDSVKSTSLRKIEANRQNAKSSTGPKTAEGKAISARNSLKFGIFAKSFLTGATPEMVEETQTLEAGIGKHYQPVGMIEELLVQKITVEVVRRASILAIEQTEVARKHAFFNVAVDRLVRYSSSIDRALFRTIEKLEQIQAQRKAQTGDLGAKDSDR